jgi:hypothetical protein
MPQWRAERVTENSSKRKVFARATSRGLHFRDQHVTKTAGGVTTLGLYLGTSDRCRFSFFVDAKVVWSQIA